MRSFRYLRLSLLLFIPGLMLSGARATEHTGGRSFRSGVTAPGTLTPGNTGNSQAYA